MKLSDKLKQLQSELSDGSIEMNDAFTRCIEDAETTESILDHHAKHLIPGLEKRIKELEASLDEQKRLYFIEWEKNNGKI